MPKNAKNHQKCPQNPQFTDKMKCNRQKHPYFFKKQQHFHEKAL